MSEEYGAELTGMMSGGQYQLTPTASGGFSGDVSDLPVFTGASISSGTFGRGQKGQHPFFGGPDERRGPRPSTMRQSQLESRFYSMAPEDRRELQRRLYAGGFYGSTDPDKIVLGVPDEVSFSAYAKAVARAASYYGAGKKMTVDEVIDESAGVLDQIYGANGRRDGGAGGDGAGRAPLTIGLTNPEDLKAVAQRTATGTIGRALNGDELNRFIASFHQAQSGAQTNAYNADETGGTVVDAPSEGAAAEAFARGAAPTEAGGNDFLRTFSAFRSILSRGA